MDAPNFQSNLPDTHDVFQPYYVGTLIISILGTLASMGQIGTWCYRDFTHFSDHNKMIVNVFFSLACVTFVLCTIMLVTSCYALKRKIGTGGVSVEAQPQAELNSIPNTSDALNLSFDTPSYQYSNLI